MKAQKKGSRCGSPHLSSLFSFWDKRRLEPDVAGLEQAPASCELGGVLRRFPPCVEAFILAGYSSKSSLGPIL